jgi:hypothetical protein
VLRECFGGDGVQSGVEEDSIEPGIQEDERNPGSCTIYSILPITIVPRKDHQKREHDSQDKTPDP